MKRVGSAHVAVLLASVLSWGTSEAVPLNQWGSGTIISIRDCAGVPSDVGCNAVDPAPTLIPFLEVGGLFVAVDEQSDLGASLGATRVEFTGQSVSPGITLDAPVIRGLAVSAPGSAAPLPPGDADTRVGVSTGAYQGYTYLGDTAATVTLRAILDFEGTSANQWGNEDSATISLTLAALGDDIVLDDGLATCPLIFCVGGTVINAVQLREDGPFAGAQPTQVLEFDLDLAAGQSFYVGATLQVLGDRGGVLDAFNTFRTEFVGDPDVLSSLVAATRVPTPSTMVLLLLGVLPLLGQRRPLRHPDR